MKNGYTELCKTHSFAPDTPIELHQRFLEVGDARAIGDDDVSGDGFIVFASGLKTVNFGDVPREFFNHQLLECKTRSKDGSRFDVESLAAFASKWGFMYAPMRYGCEYNQTFGKRPRGVASREQFIDAMAATNAADRILCDTMRDAGSSGLCRLSHEVEAKDIPQLVDMPYPVISIAEMALTIEAMQAAVLALHGLIRDQTRENAALLSDALGMLADFVNACACVPVQVGYFSLSTRAQRNPCITNLICNQIIEAIEDKSTPWRECAAPDCNRQFGAPVIFKHQQNGRTRNPDADAIYCCPKCKNRHSQQKRRAGMRKTSDVSKSERG